MKKAIIISTGERVDYIGTSAEFGTTSFIDSKGILRQDNGFSGNIKILSEKNELESLIERSLPMDITLHARLGAKITDIIRLAIKLAEQFRFVYFYANERHVTIDSESTLESIMNKYDFNK